MDFQADKGRLLENIVFIELRRRYNEIYYLKGKQEVDFYIHSMAPEQLINVALSIADKKTYEREVSGLFEAMINYKIPKSTLVIGEGQANTLVKDDYQIDIIPAWKWLLNH